MHWPVVLVRTNENTMLVRKPINETANKSRKLAGRNGHEPTKILINVTNVDFCYMV